mgnify:CR=1 FL=1
MKYDYNIIVIGAGSGGLVVASGAAGLGAKVALIEKDKMGGDCLNYGCVPSKTLLKSAHVANSIKNSDKFGIKSTISEVDINKVMNRVDKIIKSIEPHDSKERYEGLGVDVYNGIGTFVDNHNVAIGDKVISGKNIVIATGSHPFVPPISGINDVEYYTNETIFSIDKLPKELIVLGAGPIGCELSQAFSHLGSKVTIVDMLPALFTKDDPEVGPLMEQQFTSDGITLELSYKIMKINKVNEQIEVTLEKDGEQKTIVGDTLLVALGRKPSSSELDVEKAGVEISKRGHINCNEKLQTNIENIYTCGDVTGPYAFTHMASYQASIVIQNIIFPLKRKVNYDNVPWVTYTKPEVAHVGFTEQQLKEKGISFKKYFEPLKNNDRAKAESDINGFLKILTNNSGVVIGATMVGEKAGEQILVANIAINKKMKVKDFTSLTIAYPTESEIYKTIGYQALKESFTPSKKNLVKRLFLS